MKKSLLKMLALVAMTVVTFSGCKKDEDGSPSIDIIGDNEVIVTLNGIYTDLGATATDPEDGAVAVTSDESASNPDVDMAGEYTITYSATDADGNTTTAKRTVIVRNDAYDLAGTYTTTEGSDVWTQTLLPSTTKNSEITFSRFANYDNNNGMTFKVTTSGSVRTIALSPPFQAVNGIGSSGCDHEFLSNGAGAPVTVVAGKMTFSIKFSDTILSNNGCTPTGAVDYEDTFVQN